MYANEIVNILMVAKAHAGKYLLLSEYTKTWHSFQPKMWVVLTGCLYKVRPKKNSNNITKSDIVVARLYPLEFDEYVFDVEDHDDDVEHDADEP